MLETDDLIQRAARNSGLDPEIVRAVIDVLTDETRARLAQGEEVSWPGFGRLVPTDTGIRFEPQPELLGESQNATQQERREEQGL